MAPALTKGLRMQRAFKAPSFKVPGARLVPTRAIGRGPRNNFTPPAGENPVATLRVQVLGCTDLMAADRNGLSDP